MHLTPNFKETVFSYEEIKKNLNKFINSENLLETDELLPDAKIVCDFAILPNSEKTPDFLQVNEKIFVANEFNRLDLEAIEKLDKEPIFFLQFFNPFSQKTLHLDYLSSYLRMHYPNSLILADISYVIGHHPIYFENWGINEFYYVTEGKNYRIFRTADKNPSCDAFINYFAKRMTRSMQLQEGIEEPESYAPLWQFFKDGKPLYLKP